MKKILIALICLISLLGCKDDKYTACPTSTVGKRVNSQVVTCLQQADSHSETVKKYSKQELDKLFDVILDEAGKIDYRISRNNLDSYFIVLTDNDDFYNEEFWAYALDENIPDEDSEAYNVASYSRNFYQQHSHTIFVNLNIPDSSNSHEVLLHSIMHYISFNTFGNFDRNHENEELWVKFHEDVLNNL